MWAADMSTNICQVCQESKHIQSGTSWNENEGLVGWCSVSQVLCKSDQLRFHIQNAAPWRMLSNDRSLVSSAVLCGKKSIERHNKQKKK